MDEWNFIPKELKTNANYDDNERGRQLKSFCEGRVTEKGHCEHTKHF